MKVICAVAALLLVGWWFWHGGRRYAPGVLIPSDPRIELIENGAPWPYQSKDKQYELTPRATYTAKARVLSVNADYGDALIGPVDLTLGWGPMSDQAVLDRMQIWQDNTRHWFCQPRGDWPIAPGEVALHAVNTHIIPSTPQIEQAVLAVGNGDLIEVEGKLVDVHRKDGFHWNTSVDPSGFGDHSCKIIWVEKIARR